MKESAKGRFFENYRIHPYYCKAFFSTIKKVHDKSSLNPVHMTVSLWYLYLLQEGVTMLEDQEGRRAARTCGVEELHPDVDLGQSFCLAGLKGLSPDHKSLLFKLLHQLLQTGQKGEQTAASQEFSLQCLQNWAYRHFAARNFQLRSQQVFSCSNA